MRKCAQSPIQAEFTLCGDAFDAYDSGDAEEQHQIVGAGQVVDCPQCCKVIQDIREMKYRLKPRKETYNVHA